MLRLHIVRRFKYAAVGGGALTLLTMLVFLVMKGEFAIDPVSLMVGSFIGVMVALHVERLE